jgi:NADH-quinone oxidoreductase subunit H
MAILLGGWSSRNKYSLVGALRAAAQMISYEIPMILGLLVVAMVVGSLRITDVVAAQADYQWIAFYAPFTFLIFYIASIAELNRGPFDLPESESELVSGYGTEYSGMRFGMFFLNEYAGLTIMSMVTVILVFALVWIRLSLPRLQVDQLMAFAWKILIPLGLLNILATAAVMLWVPQWKWGMAVFSWIALLAFVGLFDPILKWRLRRQRDRLPVVNA